MPTKKPDRTTMEGMIWNANHVLEQALLPGAAGMPRDLFKKCKGIVLLSSVEVGFLYTGSVGTGIILAKKRDGKSWSNPCASGITGVGWGLTVGGSVKDIIIFILDDVSMNALVGNEGIRMGAKAEVTLGPAGRTAQGDLAVTSSGFGGTVAIAFSKGAFLGIGIEGGVVGARNAVNCGFYGKELEPKQILLRDEATFPKDKATVINEVYDKLKKLASMPVDPPKQAPPPPPPPPPPSQSALETLRKSKWLPAACAAVAAVTALIVYSRHRRRSREIITTA